MSEYFYVFLCILTLKSTVEYEVHVLVFINY